MFTKNHFNINLQSPIEMNNYVNKRTGHLVNDELLKQQNNNNNLFINSNYKFNLLIIKLLILTEMW